MSLLLSSTRHQILYTIFNFLAVVCCITFTVDFGALLPCSITGGAERTGGSQTEKIHTLFCDAIYDAIKQLDLTSLRTSVNGFCIKN